MRKHRTLITIGLTIVVALLILSSQALAADFELYRIILGTGYPEYGDQVGGGTVSVVDGQFVVEACLDNGTPNTAYRFVFAVQVGRRRSVATASQLKTDGSGVGCATLETDIPRKLRKADSATVMVVLIAADDVIASEPTEVSLQEAEL